MDQSKEQIAAIMTQILFSRLAHRFFDKYTEYEMQSDFLKTEILKVYHDFLNELKNTTETKSK